VKFERQHFPLVKVGRTAKFQMQMKLTLLIAASVLIFTAGIFTAGAQPSNAVTTAPVYVPDYSHANDPLPDGIIAWDDLMKAVDVTNGQDFARFMFSFTNVATIHETVLVTNLVTTTNLVAVTNSGWFWSKKISFVTNLATASRVTTDTNATRPVPVTILTVHPSCGCTTAELPPVPWLLAPGTNGQIKITVNLQGKAGTLFKSVTITTDKGRKDLMLRITIPPPPAPTPMSESERARGIAAAMIDRQAVFKGDCVSCHVKNIEGKYGQQLFDITCAICHEAKPRASMVPDLHSLTVPTNEEFWRTWIAAGKAGTLMPAFATSQGGPLNDMQIASLAAYLNAVIPSHATNAPAK
jgi:mono/diheme cytochrome c family protein